MEKLTQLDDKKPVDTGAILVLVLLLLLLVVVIGLAVIMDCDLAQKICAIDSARGRIVIQWAEGFGILAIGAEVQQIFPVSTGNTILDAAIHGGLGAIVGIIIVGIPLLILKELARG